MPHSTCPLRKLPDYSDSVAPVYYLSQIDSYYSSLVSHDYFPETNPSDSLAPLMQQTMAPNLAKLLGRDGQNIHVAKFNSTQLNSKIDSRLGNQNLNKIKILLHWSSSYLPPSRLRFPYQEIKIYTLSCIECGRKQCAKKLFARPDRTSIFGLAKFPDLTSLFFRCRVAPGQLRVTD